MDPPFVFRWNGGCPVLGEDTPRHLWGISQGIPNDPWQRPHPFHTTNFPNAPPFGFQNWCSFPRNPLFSHPAAPQQEPPWSFGSPHVGMLLERHAWQQPVEQMQPSQLRPWHKRKHPFTEAPAATSVPSPGLEAANPSLPFSIQPTLNKTSERTPAHLFLEDSTRPLLVINKKPTEALSLESSSTVTRSSNQTTKNRPTQAVDAQCTLQWSQKPPKKLQSPKSSGRKHKISPVTSPTPNLVELKSAKRFSEPTSSRMVPVPKIASETEVPSATFKNNVTQRQEGKKNAIKRKICSLLKTSESKICSSGISMTRRVSTFSTDCNTWKSIDINNMVSQNNLFERTSSNSPSTEPAQCVVSIFPTLPESAVPHCSPANVNPRQYESPFNSPAAYKSQDTNTPSAAVIESVDPSVSPRAERRWEDPLTESCNASTCSWNTHTNSVSAQTSIEPVPTLSRVDSSSMVSKWLDTSVHETTTTTRNNPGSEFVSSINLHKPDLVKYESDDVVLLQSAPSGGLRNKLATSLVKHDNSENIQVNYSNMAVEAILFELNTYTACCILDICEDSKAKKDVLKLYIDSRISSSKREYEEQIKRIVSSAIEKKRVLWKGLSGLLRRLSKIKWSLPLAASGFLPFCLHIEQIQHALLQDVAESKAP